MKFREPVTLSMTPFDLIVLLSENNPGALRVLSELLERSSLGFFLALHLDDMNIRGTQIWVGYKDHCDQDIKKFAECITRRDLHMIKTINRECGEPFAVQYGGSLNRG